MLQPFNTNVTNTSIFSNISQSIFDQSDQNEMPISNLQNVRDMVEGHLEGYIEALKRFNKRLKKENFVPENSSDSSFHNKKKVSPLCEEIRAHEENKYDDFFYFRETRIHEIRSLNWEEQEEIKIKTFKIIEKIEKFRNLYTKCLYKTKPRDFSHFQKEVDSTESQFTETLENLKQRVKDTDSISTLRKISDELQEKRDELIGYIGIYEDFEKKEKSTLKLEGLFEKMQRIDDLFLECTNKIKMLRTF
jgi:hypothetical protein